MKWITFVIVMFILVIVAFGFYQYNHRTITSPVQEVITPSQPIRMDREPARVITFNVGQGDAILVENNNTYMLVDCGPNSARDELISSILIYTQKIDYLVVTHPDEDHIGNCDSVLQNFTVDKVYTNGKNDSSQAYKDFISSLKGKKPEIAYKGMEFDIGNIDVEVIHSNVGYKKDNDNSVVMRMDYYNISFLLTGDCESQCENDLMKENIDVDFLKVAHHGSNASTSDDFLDKVTPVGAVISVGKNSYGHPSQGLIDRMVSRGISVKITDQGGDVEIATDGKPLDKTNIPIGQKQTSAGEPL